MQLLTRQHLNAINEGTTETSRRMLSCWLILCRMGANRANKANNMVPKSLFPTYNYPGTPLFTAELKSTNRESNYFTMYAKISYPQSYFTRSIITKDLYHAPAYISISRLATTVRHNGPLPWVFLGAFVVLFFGTLILRFYLSKVRHDYYIYTDVSVDSEALDPLLGHES